MKAEKSSKKQNEKADIKFVKVNVIDSANSLMQCGGGHLCNETK